MKIIAAIDLAISIEQEFSNCYRKIAQTFPESALKEDLEKLALDEISHMQLLQTGKKYAIRAPEAFPEESGWGGELAEGLALIKNLIADLENTSMRLPEALQRISDLEERFEEVHLSTLVILKDAHLAQLFKALSSGDRIHKETLQRIMSDLKL